MSEVVEVRVEYLTAGWTQMYAPDATGLPVELPVVGRDKGPYRAVLRPHIPLPVWVCSDAHATSEEAYECAKRECEERRERRSAREWNEYQERREAEGK